MAGLKSVIAAAFLVVFAAVANAADIEQVWNISYRLVYPDGVEKNVPVVNGMYPGPEIYGRVGQTVRIVVNNLMPTDTATIHWHGIRQFGTPWMDGTLSFFLQILLSDSIASSSFLFFTNCIVPQN